MTMENKIIDMESFLGSGKPLEEFAAYKAPSSENNNIPITPGHERIHLSKPLEPATMKKFIKKFYKKLLLTMIPIFLCATTAALLGWTIPAVLLLMTILPVGIIIGVKNEKTMNLAVKKVLKAQLETNSKQTDAHKELLLEEFDYEKFYELLKNPNSVFVWQLDETHELKARYLADAHAVDWLLRPISQ